MKLTAKVRTALIYVLFILTFSSIYCAKRKKMMISEYLAAVRKAPIFMSMNFESARTGLSTPQSILPSPIRKNVTIVKIMMGTNIVESLPMVPAPL